jgi:CheY-like chemotaxis protein
MMPLRGVRILVVDDSGETRELTRTLLEQRGAQVRVAEDGAAALLAMDQACPDLILCDLMMPLMDGWEFALRVRSRADGDHARLVAFSGLTDTPSLLRAWAVGFDAFLEKPLDLAKLEAVAERFLVGPRRDRRPRKADPRVLPPPRRHSTR